MDSNSILNAWKQSEGRDSIANVAGAVVVDENLLRQIGGGALSSSSGYICTISGECNGGRSCWPWRPSPIEDSLEY
jgi:hypothetical protein